MLDLITVKIAEKVISAFKIPGKTSSYLVDIGGRITYFDDADVHRIVEIVDGQYMVMITDAYAPKLFNSGGTVLRTHVAREVHTSLPIPFDIGFKNPGEIPGFGFNHGPINNPRMPEFNLPEIGFEIDRVWEPAADWESRAFSLEGLAPVEFDPGVGMPGFL